MTDKELKEKFPFKDKHEAELMAIKALLYLAGYTSLSGLHKTITPMYYHEVHCIKIPFKKLHYAGIPIELVPDSITCAGVELYRPLEID